jgi:hypothetical protein
LIARKFNTGEVFFDEPAHYSWNSDPTVADAALRRLDSVGWSEAVPCAGNYAANRRACCNATSTTKGSAIGAIIGGAGAELLLDTICNRNVSSWPNRRRRQKFNQPKIFNMSSLDIALISAAFIFGGVLLGLWLQNLLPGHHLGSESKDTIKLAAGMIATLSALVLGLLVSSAKNNFDTTSAEITQGAAKAIQLDRALANYGPETGDARELLRHSVAAGIQMFWPEAKTEAPGMTAFEKANGMELLQAKLRELTPAGDAQRQLLAQAQQISGELLQFRWLLIEQTQNALPVPFLVMVLFWLTMLHMSFGLFAPRNAMVIVVLLICALSVSGAIFLILEMNHPLSGTIKVSSAPMLKALEHLGQ